jgi:hypothetical protein
MAQRRVTVSGCWVPIAFLVGWTVLLVGDFTGRSPWLALVALFFLLPSCVALWIEKLKRRP